MQSCCKIPHKKLPEVFYAHSPKTKNPAFNDELKIFLLYWIVTYEKPIRNELEKSGVSGREVKGKDFVIS
jgi:hypothetical protein